MTVEKRAAKEQKCELHKVHQPRNLTVEWHHILPVAWQLHITFPERMVKPSPGADTDGRGELWDNRGAWICPTGHRNVHTWLVMMMHALHDLGAKDDDQQSLVSQAIDKIKPRAPVAVEFSEAQLALQRFMPYGNLFELTEHGLWGQA